jgi:hypothetical protein
MVNLTKHQRSLIRAAGTSVGKLRRVMNGLGVRPTGVACSFVPFTILSKAFNVHAGVLLLCKTGLPSEAIALSRIMIEMYIGLRWATNQDQSKRCEEYAHFVAARKRHFAKVREDYYATNPNTPQYVQWVDNVFGKHAAMYKDLNFWADVEKKLWGMASEQEVLYGAAPPEYRDLKFDYKSFYSLASDHVHATMEALVPLIPPTGCTYKVPLPNAQSGRRMIEIALVTARCFFMYIIARVDVWRELGIRNKIDAASLPFEAVAGIKRGIVTP